MWSLLVLVVAISVVVTALTILTNKSLGVALTNAPTLIVTLLLAYRMVGGENSLRKLFATNDELQAQATGKVRELSLLEAANKDQLAANADLKNRLEAKIRELTQLHEATRARFQADVEQAVNAGIQDALQRMERERMERERHLASKSTKIELKVDPQVPEEAKAIIADEFRRIFA